MRKFRDFIINLKVYMARTASYIGLLNTAMILFLFLSNLEKYGIDIEIKDSLLPLFIVGLFLMLLFGYLEYKFFYEQEQRKTSGNNPYILEIVERLDRIEKKLNKKR